MENPKEKRALAEAKFERTQRKAAESAAAMHEYEANAQTQRLKTEHLRALRLARDAEKPADAPQKGKTKRA